MHSRVTTVVRNAAGSRTSSAPDQRSHADCTTLGVMRRAEHPVGEREQPRPVLLEPLVHIRETKQVPVLLVVHHTTSPALQSLLEAARAGAAMVEDVQTVVRPALTAGAADLLAADGVLLGTPANIGYMSGALKHFFDTVYYPCLEATVGTPYGVYVHGQNDTGGAVRSIEQVVTALKWKPVAAPLSIIGAPTKEQLEECTELGGTVAATLVS
jgi:NAD(P)H-dependent FMN reductase